MIKSPTNSLVLDTLLSSSVERKHTTYIARKACEAIAQMVPGLTVAMCRARYEALLRQQSNNRSDMVLSLSELSTTNALTDSSSNSEPCDKSEHPNTTDVDVDKNTNSVTVAKRSNANGPVMVIHVCDESKNLKEDFHCPRDILMAEMQYFAEYLSSESHRVEDVDISVHCDIAIFDWLIRYVKRNTREASPEPPTLDPLNVVSILISSDFLKMTTLVQECIGYCQANMSAILSAPCNMNCINNDLLTRLADSFSLDALDTLKDRKDKFRSKLFTKKIERLFDASTTNDDSKESAATLFRCVICKRILTDKLKTLLKCDASRMTVDHRGRVAYIHVNDPLFEVNAYILKLKSEVTYWRDVYWRLWGQVNFMHCLRCHEDFPLTEFEHCRYHPQTVTFDDDFESHPPMKGVYPCCNSTAYRFQPIYHNSGCRVRDHLISTPTTVGDQGAPHSNDTVYELLLSHRDVICVPFSFQRDEQSTDVDVFSNGDKILSHVSPSPSNKSTNEKSSDIKVEKKSIKGTPVCQTVFKPSFFRDYDDVGCGESEDEREGEDKKGKRMWTRMPTVRLELKSALSNTTVVEKAEKCMWDNQRSLRWNQDAQRQEDLRRMRDICHHLRKLRIDHDKHDKAQPKMYAGGLFSRVDHRWKLANTIVSKGASVSSRSRQKLVNNK